MAPIDHAALDEAIRRNERERCARIAESLADDAQNLIKSEPEAAAAAQLARRIAWSIRIPQETRP